MKIGVISDTHGHLNPAAQRLFDGVERILHAGDIGDEAVLQGLRAVAPVTAVRGNNDKTGAVSRYPEEELVDVAGKRLLLTHQVTLPKGPEDPALAAYLGVDAVVSGHSHIARQGLLGGVLFLNPGAAGKPRFRLTPSAGILTIEDGVITFAIETLARG
jgi:putative phosphoesterase